MLKCHIFIFYTFCEISRQRELLLGQAGLGRIGSGWPGPGRFLVLNDPASPKTVLKMYLHFFIFFLKVLELLECRRGDPYMIANRNFVRFAHS